MPADGVWTTFTCPDGGITGARITLIRTSTDQLAFCGINVDGIDPAVHLKYVSDEHDRLVAEF